MLKTSQGGRILAIS